MMKAAVLTISDRCSRGEREDRSGPALAEAVERAGGEVVTCGILPDEREQISAKLRELVASGRVDLILTTGGTGLAPRDVTPEATLSVVDKVVPGIAEAMRSKSLEKTPMAVLSRAAAGIRGRCLIINLPGSPKAVQECLEVVLPAIPHAIEIIKGEVTEHTFQDAGAS